MHHTTIIYWIKQLGEKLLDVLKEDVTHILHPQLSHIKKKPMVRLSDMPSPAAFSLRQSLIAELEKIVLHTKLMLVFQQQQTAKLQSAR